MSASHASQVGQSRRPGGPALLHGWVLLAGISLAAAGLAFEPAQNPPPPPFQTQILPTAPAIGNSDSNSRMIAVTGTDITGASVLYVIDTIDPHISVYQASGGTKSTQGIKWVGARRIDLDLSVDGWNDKSSMKYSELEERFQKDNLIPGNR